MPHSRKIPHSKLCILDFKQGFTLIELMVVISIIAILASIGLVVYSTAQKGARDSKRVQDVLEIQKALEQYYALNNKYPGANGDSTTNYHSINTYFQNGSPPTDPSSNADYSYVGCPSSEQYILCTKLESCGSKCNVNWTSAGSPDCSVSIGQSASGNNFYCAAGLSN